MNLRMPARQAYNLRTAPTQYQSIVRALYTYIYIYMLHKKSADTGWGQYPTCNFDLAIPTTLHMGQDFGA